MQSNFRSLHGTHLIKNSKKKKKRIKNYPHLCGKVVYDSNRDTGIKGCRAQGETECVRNKGLETSFFTDLDQSTAAVTTNLLADNTHTQLDIGVFNHTNRKVMRHKGEKKALPNTGGAEDETLGQDLQQPAVG